MTNDELALRATVHGRVQGVGFRFFVRDVAVALGLTGYVRNLSNGSVEVVAEGQRASLDALVKELRKGPALSRVERVDESCGDASGGYEDFGIR